MLLTKRGALFILGFVFLLSIIANIYTFTTRNDTREEYENRLSEAHQALKKNEESLQAANEQIASLEINKEKPADKDESKETEGTENQEEQISPDKYAQLSNTAKRFMEYSFNTNTDNYAERKKLARNYMTDRLYETIYSADGVAEAEQKTRLELGRMDIYLKENASNEAIVYYEMDSEIVDSGHTETIKDYVKLKFADEDQQWKVTELHSLGLMEGGTE